ncbi:50S ribosomal protein L18 [Sphingomonas rhizophila]|uniref:Large ribosomal subunit protein uL18 n=1 Tax=Sphingomonas rhizophila TaxID=2071607 RepID=A0A7G9S942_9SPHN|nr:50S ribosomal protein L18 [Sphingomonas rhizophila]QNN64367.1 50S ribosomal protein L18 [Sphingomonas rhizophila]
MAKLSLFDRRRRRVRTALRARASGKPRLSVHRSGKHIYAQLIDDAAGKTIAAASTLDKDLKKATGSATRDAAASVGKALAERAKKAGVSAVVFDRGGFLFHGRVKALADAAREGGLEF